MHRLLNWLQINGVGGWFPRRLFVEEKIIERAGNVKTMQHPMEDMQISSKERLRSRQKTCKSVLTRQKIMDAACELMSERGSTNFQMSEVSDRCSMSKGALYYYFCDRGELVSAIFDSCVDDLVRGIEEKANEAPKAADALRELYGEFMRRLEAGSPLALALTYEISGSPDSSLSGVANNFTRVSSVIATQVERAKGEGLVREDVDSQVAAGFITGGLVTTALIIASGHLQPSLVDIPMNVNAILLHGIGAQDTSA